MGSLSDEPKKVADDLGYPPVPAGLMRDIAKGGNRVLDDILPEGVSFYTL